MLHIASLGGTRLGQRFRAVPPLTCFRLLFVRVLSRCQPKVGRQKSEGSHRQAQALKGRRELSGKHALSLFSSDGPWQFFDPPTPRLRRGWGRQ